MNRKVRSIGLAALAVVVLGGALTSCTRESKTRAQETPQVHGTVYLSTHPIHVFHEKKNGWLTGTSLPLDKTACDPLLQAMGGASVTVHDGQAGPVLATLDVGAPTLDPQSATLPEGTHLDGWGALGHTKSRKAACWATAPFQGPIPKSPDGRYTLFIEGVDEAKTMGNFFARSGYYISYSDLAAQGFQLALGGGDDFEKAWQALVANRAGQSASSSASIQVDPIVGTWVSGGVTLKIAADGSYDYTQKLVQGRPPMTTTGTWKTSGDGYAWKFSDPHAKYWGFWVFPDIGTRGTWHLSSARWMEQSPGPHTSGTSYTRSPGS